MKCSCCGKELSSNDRYCPNCGQNNPSYVEPVRVEVVEEQKQQSQSTSQNSNYQSNNYYEPPRPVYIQQESKTVAILALIFSILGGWLGLLFAIVGLVTYKDESNRSLCKVALLIFVAEVVIVIVVYAALIGAMR